MFQNMHKNDKIEISGGEAAKRINSSKRKETKTNLFSNVLDKKNMLIYIITFMISRVGMEQPISPFGLAMVVACMSYGIPAIGVIAIGLISTLISFSSSGALTYMLILLVFIISIMIREPKYSEENRNEQMRMSVNLGISILLVTMGQTLMKTFSLYNILANISFMIITVLFYKIFVNSIGVFQEFTEKKAFSIEEVIGASLLLSIAISGLGKLQIFGFSIKNILSILIVLILGWKNGVLIGTTSGVTIGVVLGIISQTDPIVVSAYALCGMIAGLLNKFGKIGVIIGFILGNVILSYVTNGNLEQLILFKEILIASLGLLAVPSKIKIDIEELKTEDKYLPETSKYALNRSKETIEKLEEVSNAIQDMAETYNSETVDEKETIEQKNKDIFISELLNNLDGMQNNMLYDDMVKPNNKIVDELFEILLKKQEITRKDLLKTFAKFNNYIIGFDDEKVSQHLENNIRQIVSAVNDAYKTGKLNFIYEEKIKENRKNIQAQLGGVSKVISNLATEMEENIEKEENYIKEKEEILYLITQKKIKVQDISIQKKPNERFFIKIYSQELEENSIENNQIEKIEKILTKVLKEKIVINTEANKGKEKYAISFMSDDKYNLFIGVGKCNKANNSVSGDSMLQQRLKDGKYLVAISDGMGTGPEARKSSQIAIKMLGRLLSSGFDKDTSIELINNTILNTAEDIYATLDLAIIDLYKGTIEFIKNGSCPTYIKNKKSVQLIKSLSLPAGLLQNANITAYDKDIINKEIMVMCSDGIIDSNIEYKNKELWIRYLLEDIETENCKKIADIILNEAIDHNYGKAKDDMSIIVCRFATKENYEDLI